MGVESLHVLGREGKFFATVETVYGTRVKHTATDAVKMLNVSFDFQHERIPRMDTRNTRSLLERIAMRKSVKWSAEGYLIPSGSAGTPPDIHPLLLRVFSGYVNTGSTSDVYSLANSQTALESLTLSWGDYAELYSQAIAGAIVDRLTINTSESQEPRLKWEGMGANMYHTGTSTLNGAMSGSTTMVVQTVDGDNFEAGSLVKVDNTVGTNGLQVTVDSARPSFTVDASVTESDASTVVPYLPSETTAGSPLAGTAGSLNIAVTGGPGAANIPITEFECTIANNVNMIQEALTEYPTDYTLPYREVTGSFTFRARKDLIIYLANRKHNRDADVAVTIGNAAGRRLVIDLPKIVFDLAPLEIPSELEAIVRMPFVALSSALANEDEVKWSFT